MISLDDCNRQELKRLARFSTPAQIAEAKARIAREAANRENQERIALSTAAIEAARAVRQRFELVGADHGYRRLFDDALLAARRSEHAQKRWARFEAHAQRLERAARAIRRQDPRAVGRIGADVSSADERARSERQDPRAVGLAQSERQK